MSTKAKEKDEERKREKRKLLYNQHGQEKYRQMFSNPKNLAQSIFDSELNLEFLILGITYPYLGELRSPYPSSSLRNEDVNNVRENVTSEENKEVDDEKKMVTDIQGLENLVAELNSIYKTEEYTSLTPDRKQDFLNRINALAELREMLTNLF
jgi:hypothetical protein